MLLGLTLFVTFSRMWDSLSSWVDNRSSFILIVSSFFNNKSIIINKNRRNIMGNNSFDYCKEKFNVNIVNKLILNRMFGWLENRLTENYLPKKPWYFRFRIRHPIFLFLYPSY